MRYDSVWSDTKTFFPLLLDFLARQEEERLGNACVVGAADGKFVVPLAQVFRRVTAIEVDSLMVKGGMAPGPGGVIASIPGLIRSIQKGLVSDRVDLVHSDFADYTPLERFDLVFTSCSWHYSRNLSWGSGAFIDKMMSLVSLGGVFCAEYMMPCENKHRGHSGYLQEGDLSARFDEKWKVVYCFYTEPFCEFAHVGNTSDHIHKMGFLLAIRSKE